MIRILLMSVLVSVACSAAQTTTVEINTSYGWSLGGDNEYSYSRFDNVDSTKSEYLDLEEAHTTLGNGLNYDLTVKKSINEQWGLLLSVGYSQINANTFEQIVRLDSTPSTQPLKSSIEKIETKVTFIPFGIGVYFEATDYFLKPYGSASFVVNKIQSYTQNISKTESTSNPDSLDLHTTELEYDIDLGFGVDARLGLYVPLFDNLMLNGYGFVRQARNRVKSISRTFDDVTNIMETFIDKNGEQSNTDIAMTYSAPSDKSVIITSAWGVGLGIVFRY
ncbi:MAG: hypothetical protein OCD01_16755 [Fibrobacterales bacterium]